MACCPYRFSLSSLSRAQRERQEEGEGRGTHTAQVAPLPPKPSMEGGDASAGPLELGADDARSRERGDGHIHIDACAARRRRGNRDVAERGERLGRSHCPIKSARARAGLNGVCCAFFLCVSGWQCCLVGPFLFTACSSAYCWWSPDGKPSTPAAAGRARASERLPTSCCRERAREKTLATQEGSYTPRSRKHTHALERSQGPHKHHHPEASNKHLASKRHQPASSSKN